MSSTEPQNEWGKKSGESRVKSPGVAHEESDADVRDILRFGAALFVAVMFTNFLLWGFYSFLKAGAEKGELKPPPLASERQSLPPEPRLQGAPGHEEFPASDLGKFREQENQMLGSFGWVDRKAGI